MTEQTDGDDVTTVVKGDEPGDWEFDDEVAENFDRMLARSIPQYDVMRRAVASVARRFVVEKTDILDLGSSRGDAIAPLVETFGAHCRYHLVEISDPMVEILRERFAGLIDTPSGDVVRIHHEDLRDGLPAVRASVALSVLTLQFVPINYRQQIVQGVYDQMRSGGAFVLVEKVLGNTAPIDDLMVDLYHEMKRERGGYSGDEIERKRLALEGELVPVTADWNRELLEQAGFRRVDCFWRWMNFAAWVAVK